MWELVIPLQASFGDSIIQSQGINFPEKFAISDSGWDIS
jgi:hypothetical protein